METCEDEVADGGIISEVRWTFIKIMGWMNGELQYEFFAGSLFPRDALSKKKLV